MDNKTLKLEFDRLARNAGFTKAFSGWYKESPECLAILELQKSNYANYYYLRIKVYIQGAFGNTYAPTKELMKDSIGSVGGGAGAYGKYLDLTEPMEDKERIEGLAQLFKNKIIPFTDQTLTKAGIVALAEKGDIVLLPAVKEELEKLGAL